MSRTNWLILTLAALAALAGGYVDHRRASDLDSGAAQIGQSAPEVTLRDLDGKLHPLSGYRGRRVILNFWASWCGPCLEEMPALEQAEKNVGENGAIVLGIAMDDPEHVRAFLAGHPVNYPILLGDLRSPSTSYMFGNKRQLLPYSVLIDADGRILATHTGMLTRTALNTWFDAGKRPR
jgi:peroxiredoxin